MDIITRRVKATTIGLPKWAKDAVKKHGLEADSVQLIRKGITPEDTKFKESERSSVDYITTKAIDRDGEIVVPSGAVLDHYRNNPVVLFGHDYKSLPVGKSLWIKADEKGLISKTQYAKHQKAEDIYQYRKDGFPMAKSIGFIPLEAYNEEDFGKLDLKALGLEKSDLTGASTVYTKWLMLEYSDVPVPSNPEALQLAISKGIITMDEAKKASEKDNAFVMEIIEPKEKGVIVEINTSSGDDIRVWADGDATAPGDDGEKEVDDDAVEKEYECECIKCSYHTTSSGHCKDMSCPECGGTMRRADRPGPGEESAAGEKEAVRPEAGIKTVIPKEEIEKRYGKEAVVFETKDPTDKLVVKSFKFKKVKGISELWNKSIGKDFNADEIEAPASAKIYELASEWLSCEIKDIYVHDTDIPGGALGTMLTGLDEALKGYEVEGIRNLNRHGEESPPNYSIIQLNSKRSSDFLTNGIGFYKSDEGTRFIIRRSPSWYGIEVTLYSSTKDAGKSVKVFYDMYKWADENDFRKGEAFSLGGEFINKTEDGWGDVFLDEKNTKAVKSTTDLLNKKGKELANRGVIFMGPAGTGKTLSGRIMMNSLDATFIWVSARDFSYSGSVGGIRYAFDLGRKLAPSVLFIEDIDNWLDARATDLLKTEMDGLSKSKGLVTILTSNFPERLPDALIDRPGRFHDLLNFSLPSLEIRVRMIKAWAPDVKQKMLDSVVVDTAGFSGAHMFELVAFAKTIAEEEEIDIGDAIVGSLEKLKDQKRLIDEIRDPDKKEVLAEIEKGVTVPIVEKSGRVLSKKTRSLMTGAVDAMAKAIDDLKSVIESADSSSTEDVPEVEAVVDEKIVIDIKEKEVAEDGIQYMDVDENKLKEAITDTLTDILSQKRVDVNKLVKERLDLAKGRVS